MARVACDAMVVRGDSVEILEAGRDKAACIEAAKLYVELATPSEIEEVYVLAALGGAMQFRRRLSPKAPEAPAPEDEAKELRRILKEAGKSYSPNAGLERLREQVAALESEAE